MSERWLPVVGFEGLYEVSDAGRVRSLDRSVNTSNGQIRRYRGQELSPTSSPKGHLYVSLCRKAGTKFLVHRLVLAAFVGPCPDGLEGCHGDGDASNNGVANLRWDTSSSNQFDKVRHGRHHNAVKTHCKRGHPFTPENTYVIRSGRNCIVCKSEQDAARYQQRKQAAA